MTQADTLQQISEKLDTIIAFLATRELSDSGEIFEKLADMGFDAKTIAPVAGITENAVAIRLSRRKKKAKKKSKKVGT